jgi:predicted nucleotidyltransferase
MLKEKFRELETRLLEEIKSFYRERLISVVIYGSVARETQTFESDLDLLIIAKDLPQGRMKRIREFDNIESKIEPFLKSLRQEENINTYISPIIKTPEEAKRGSPLFLDMVEDSKILFDKEGFFETLLKRLKERLKKLGAKRIWKGNAWYWDLKPDYKPGDVIEL